MATYTLDNVQANHAITVAFKPIGFVVNSSIVLDEFMQKNGTINPEGNTNVLYNGTYKLTITPNVGYEIDEVLLDGLPVALDVEEPEEPEEEDP